MPSKIFSNYIFPGAIFAAGMVGVGFLSLPYVASKAGIFAMAFYFVFLAFAIARINMLFADVALATPDQKRFPGFAGYHLGNFAQYFSSFAWIISSLGVLLVYIIVASQFLADLFPLHTGNDSLYWAFLYFACASALVFWGIKAISKIEFFVLVFLVLAVVFILFEGFGKINPVNFLNFKFQISNLFLPYGPVLFSLWGAGMVPELEESMPKNKKQMKNVMLATTVAVALFYFLFVVAVLGVCGGKTSPTAFLGLKEVLGGKVVLVAELMGALATFTAFTSLGVTLKKIFQFDLGAKHWQAFVISCFTPFILFLLGMKSFMPIISLIGGVFLGIDAILILLMHRKISSFENGFYRFQFYFLSCIFLLGMLYEVINFIK